MLIEDLNKDIVENMKSKNTVDLTILKTLKADIQKVSIDKQKEIDDDMVLDVVSKSVKQFNDALEIYQKAEQVERITETVHRIELISKYLPVQMSEAEVLALVLATKVAVNAVSKKDMGKMMKELSPKTKGKFDAKKLSQIVNSVLE